MSLVVVFVLGLVAMAEGFLLWLLPGVGILAFAATLVITVLAGFAIRTPGWRQVSIPALPMSGRRLMEGMYSAQHPQVFRFRIDLRNLYLLNLATLYAVALAILALSGKYARVFSYEFPMTLGIVLAAYCLFLAVTWLKERRLLKTSIAAMGLVDPPHPVSLKPSFGYQYFDQNGQRRGGIVPFHRRLMSKPDRFTPVFFSATNPEFCKPGFAFLFHRFEIADSRHAAAFIAERT